jgi:hypothetical protein
LNGRRGGRPKGSTDKKKRAKKEPKTQSVNSGNPNITLTTNHKPLTNSKNIYKKIDVSEVPEELRPNVQEFIDHRINLKKPLTQNAQDRFMGAVYSASTELNITPARVISETIDAGWQSVKSDWLQNRIGVNHAQNRPRGNPAASGRKLTPAERTEAARQEAFERELAGEPPTVGVMDSNGGDVRAYLGKSAG